MVEGKLVPDLKARLRGIENFYTNVNGIFSKSLTEIDETKSKLNREIRAIGDLKEETEAMSTYASLEGCADLRDIVVGAAKTLIAKCTTYRNKH